LCNAASFLAGNCCAFFSEHNHLKHIQKTEIGTKEHNNVQKLTYESETSILTKIDRNKLNIRERKAHRRILGPVYDNEKENWRILTNKEIY
jgi:hypothetical protein